VKTYTPGPWHDALRHDFNACPNGGLTDLARAYEMSIESLVAIYMWTTTPSELRKAPCPIS